jgi:hypothetical protein
MNAVASVVSDRDGLTDEFLRSACIRAASSPLKGESNDVADGVGFDQESVVSELRVDDVDFILTRQQTRDLQLLFQRVEAVAGDAGDRDARAHCVQCFRDAASSTTDVVMVHGFT